jgi:hypothetical protein
LGLLSFASFGCTSGQALRGWRFVGSNVTTIFITLGEAGCQKIIHAIAAGGKKDFAKT